MIHYKNGEIFLSTMFSLFTIIPLYETDASGFPIFLADSKITTEEFKIKYDEVAKDYSINKLREARNLLLTETDWTQLNDVKLSNIDEWNTYRQALRDLPSTQPDIKTDNNGNLINPVFPTKPL